MEVRALVKRYGSRPAVDGIDLTVEHGKVFALLGPNRGGKTTTVEILEGHRSRGALLCLLAFRWHDPSHA